MPEDNFDAHTFDVVSEANYHSSLVNWKELWRYRDLILLMVRRDFVARYKQTILGPAWAIVQPLASTLIFAAVFGDLAGLSPSGVPTFLFYLAGQVLWTFFSNCVTTVSNTFLNNANLMSKVYYPRFASPVATVLTQTLSFIIQALLLLFFYAVFVFSGYSPQLNWTMFLLPLYLTHLIILALGTGAILSSLTTKYRDTVFVLEYGISLWMYITPVIYDLSAIPADKLALYLINPLTPIFVQVRYAIFGMGEPLWIPYFISLAVSVVIFFIGYRVFSHVERTFVDTI